MPLSLGDSPPHAPTPLTTTPSTPVHRTPTPHAAPSGEPSPFARLLSGLGSEVNKGEAIVKGAIAASRAGQDLGAGELLALQAGVYRYSEAVDLAAKLVDRASSGVKSVIQGQ
ncbi:hypothetical protein BH09MYX1_BH09MYX1_09910 [soil metagenome]